MEDDPDAAEDERSTELSSIAAIFPELVVDSKQPYSATLDLSITPLKPLRIAFKASADSAPPNLPTPPTSTEQGDEGKTGSTGQRLRGIEKPTPQADEHDLSHLPPLTLKITLPDTYPSERPPSIGLSVSPPWIPKTALKSLKADCARLWEELGKDQVVYTYIDHLQQAGDSAFGLAEENIQLSSDLKLALLDFDLKTKREVFEKETFDCGICLEPKKGVNCHRLMLCSHVFCVACLQDFFNNCIKEGDVDNVKCLDPDCGKEKASQSKDESERPKKRRKQDRSLNPSELLQIPLEQEVVQRYVRLKRKKKLEADKNTVYCPRQWCQGAARSKKHPKPIDPMNDVGEEASESEAETPASASKSKKANKEDPPMSERLNVCEDCDYAFCSVCKKTWHGELAICNPRRQNELNEEEQASVQYLKAHTTACPTCSAPSQKSMGCNHMICFKCSTHFCYLCSSYLMPDNPYRHFNDLKSRCYMRLWELEGGDGDDVGIGYAGGPGRAEWEPEDTDDSDESSASSDDNEFADFDDDFVGFSDDEDIDSSDDEEPAPDQRRPNRNFQVEIINFAREGANQRIIHNIPEHPRAAAAPPAAPAPPRANRDRARRGGGQLANRQARMRQEPHRAIGAGPAGALLAREGLDFLQNDPPRRLPPPGAIVAARPLVRNLTAEEEAQADADDDADDETHIPGVRAAPAPGQGNGAAQQPAPVRQLGLERFLAMAARDEEDEWDSDELDDEVEIHQVDREEPRNARGQQRGAQERR